MNDLDHLAAKTVEVLSEYDDKMFFLLSKKGDPNFTAKLSAQFAPKLRAAVGIAENDPYIDYIVAYMSSASTGLLVYWYENGKKNKPSGIDKAFATSGFQRTSGMDTER